jgi:hypothetical protein
MKMYKLVLQVEEYDELTAEYEITDRHVVCEYRNPTTPKTLFRVLMAQVNLFNEWWGIRE